ncbi:hypothetical protein ZWY2020_021362 [Hordeum vulgare]|nr:hypothetical protein ZWY2020_021362 [Hordeum vulgare]
MAARMILANAIVVVYPAQIAQGLPHIAGDGLMEVVAKIAEPEGPWVATAQQPNNLELPASPVTDAAREGESTRQPDEKDLSAEGEESSGEGGRSSFSGVSHPPEPVDVDLMSAVYVAVDAEKPGPPECLLPGPSARGLSMEDISVHATDVEPNVVEEVKVPGAPVPEPPGEAVPSAQPSEEKDRVRGASLPPSGNGSPRSGSDSAGAVAATSIRNSCASTCRSGSIAGEPVVTAGRTHDSAKGGFRGSSMESINTSTSQASDSSDDSSWSNATGTASKPHKGNDPRWRAILAVRARGSALGMSHFRLLRRLGCGDIGSVYLSELSGTRCHFAMKVMDKASLASRKKLSRAQTEREILQLLDHPFLPTLYTHFETDRFSCLVMEFCPGGDLHALRQRQPRKHFSEHAARFYAAEILLALEYLHMLGVVYRDLKPENVLVRDDGHIMLSDFDLSLQQCAVSPTLIRAPAACDSDRRSAGGGFCARPSACMEPSATCVQPACFMPGLFGRRGGRRRGSEPGQGVSAAALPELVAEPTAARSMSFVGTHEYLAPEIIKGEGHGSAVDWWTLGVFLHELLYGRTPFKGSGNRATLFNVVGQQLRFPEWPSTSYAARDLVRGLLVKEPQQRLGVKRGAAEIKQHPFFEGVNWALIRCSTPPQVPKPVEAEPPAKCGATQQPPASGCGERAIGAEVKSGGKFLDFEFF